MIAVANLRGIPRNRVGGTLILAAHVYAIDFELNAADTNIISGIGTECDSAVNRRTSERSSEVYGWRLGVWCRRVPEGLGHIGLDLRSRLRAIVNPHIVDQAVRDLSATTICTNADRA